MCEGGRVRDMSLGILILFFSLFFFILIGIPLFFSLGLSTLVTILYTGGNTIIIIQRMFATFETFPFLAIFLFSLMGIILAKTGVTTFIVNFVESIVGDIYGGLGIVTVWSSAFFGALTGSSPGTVSAIGSVMIPEMKQRGYPLAFASALVAASGILGQMIPPSIAAITYGVVMNVSIGKLFMALIIPGLTIAVTLSILCYIISKKNGYKGVVKNYSKGEKINLFLKAAPGLILPISVIGGIYGGVFTPTEAGAVGSVVAIILGSTIYKSKKQNLVLSLKDSFIEASITCSTILLIIASSSAFSYFFSIKQIPQMIASSLLRVTENPIILLVLFNVLLIFLGMFLEGNAIIIMMGPLMMSLFVPLNINLIYLGCLIIFNTLIGCITPPLGVNLYVACGVGKIEFEKLSREIIPFILTLFVLLLILTILSSIFPGIMLN